MRNPNDRSECMSSLKKPLVRSWTSSQPRVALPKEKAGWKCLAAPPPNVSSSARCFHRFYTTSNMEPGIYRDRCKVEPTQVCHPESPTFETLNLSFECVLFAQQFCSHSRNTASFLMQSCAEAAKKHALRDAGLFAALSKNAACHIVPRCSESA